MAMKKGRWKALLALFTGLKSRFLYMDLFLGQGHLDTFQGEFKIDALGRRH